MKKVLEKLLGRALVCADGYDLTTIQEAEKRLGRKLPTALKEYYYLAGRLPMFASSFQKFSRPEELQIVDDYLVFLEEHQVVCIWGVAEGENPYVQMATAFDSKTENWSGWYSESLKIYDFIVEMLYYQCAEAGYEFVGCLDETKIEQSELESLTADWQLVVASNGVMIFWQPDCLLHFYLDRKNGLPPDFIEHDPKLPDKLTATDARKIYWATLKNAHKVQIIPDSAIYLSARTSAAYAKIKEKYNCTSLKWHK